MENVKKGARFKVIKDFPTHVMTSWGKPYSGSEDCILPEDTIMIAPRDQVKGARGFGVVPERYEEMEKKLIPGKILADKDYGGYHFVFLNEDYGKHYVYLKEDVTIPTNTNYEKIGRELYTLFIGRREKIIDNPSPEDIREGVTFLNVKNVSNPFYPRLIWMKKDRWNFIRFITNEKGFFNCDYGESKRPPLTENFVCKEDYDIEDVIEILISYLDGTDKWKKNIEIK